MIKSLIFSLVVSCILTPSLAQQGSVVVLDNTIRWQASAYVDEITNDRVETPSLFITRTNQQIEWDQGEEHTVMIVVSVESDWLDLAQDGSTTYVVRMQNDSNGTFIVKRLNGILSASLEVPGLSGGDVRLSFEILSATVL